MVETAEELVVDKTLHYSYPSMTKTLGGFKLTVESGTFTDSEIIVMLGENGTGKTTFVRLLAGDKPDNEADTLSLAVSLKPQTISPKFPGTVRMLLLKQIRQAFMHAQFQTDVLKPMNLENIMDQEVETGKTTKTVSVFPLVAPVPYERMTRSETSIARSERRVSRSESESECESKFVSVADLCRAVNQGAAS